jgi:uncharacterized cupin superfamily protein
MSERPIVNIDDIEWTPDAEQGMWGGDSKALSPLLSKKPGALGMNVSRVRKGHTYCPFHYHMREDEIFYVLSGRGVLRYGDELYELRPGDCVSLPAGTKIAHQLANPYDEDFVYLGIGRNDPDEVCVYPDSGKVMVRALGTVGVLAKTEYMHGESMERPKIFDLVEQRPRD